MRKVKPVRMLWALGIAAVGLLPLAGAASAQSTYAYDLSTERSGSVLIYPKVIWDGTRDTIIRISNTSNSMAHAHCFYVDGANACNETDFDVWLTRQQPTVWVASQGRTYLNDSGLSPGLIPPVPQGFKGELKCVEVDDSFMPLRKNSLTGQASLINRIGDVSEYNAIAFQGNADMGLGTDTDLPLNLTPANQAGLYSSCPAVLLFDHFAEGATDMVNGTTLSTELTLVPCSEDLEHQLASSRVVNFDIINEFENHFSVPLSFTCYFNQPLIRIGGGANPDRGPFTIQSLLSQSAYSRITSSNGGVIGLAEEFRSGTGAAAFNLENEGYQFDPNSPDTTTDHIILPQP